MEKPNIVFILTDQQRHDPCGCYGQELNITPNLDKMAEQGVLFTNAFSCQPVCTPARAVIQTGRYATEVGVFRNGVALPISDQNLANYMSDVGYSVGYIGKWHLASNILTSKKKYGKRFNYSKKAVPLELRGGYKDFWLAADALEFTSKPYNGHLFDKDMNKIEFERQYRVDFLTDEALEYLDTHEKTQPFFLFISYLEPHHQNEHVIGGHFQGPEGSKEKFKDFIVPKDLEGLEGNWSKEYPDYLGCCHNIDENLERIQDKLQHLELTDNTLIIFASDHGCHFKTRNSEYKRSCHEGSIHIPLVIKGPGFKGGIEITELVSQIDMAPTLLRAAGVEIPNQMKGGPLQELIDGQREKWPQEVFIQISESQVGRAIRTKKWKYSVRAPWKIGFIHSHSKKYREDCLYDLENDPYEKYNLVDDPKYTEVRSELSEILKRKMEEAGENIPRIVPKQK